MNINRHHSNHRMSQMVIHGDTVYLAGQVANTPAAGVKTQTQEVLAKIDALLATAGTDKSNILSATVWLANIGHFALMNEAWDAWLAADNKPARACVEARLASPDLLVEVGIIAAKSSLPAIESRIEANEALKKPHRPNLFFQRKLPSSDF